MQHIEFFHIGHFENNYFREKPLASLSHFIDFFWETDFEELLRQYPEGFSDALFPNIGYTYLINLGSPYVMQVEDQRFGMKTDGFLPRHKAIECYHSPVIRSLGSNSKSRRCSLKKRSISLNIGSMCSH